MTGRVCFLLAMKENLAKFEWVAYDKRGDSFLLGRTVRSLTFSTCILLNAAGAYAQVTVQQPVVRSTSVGTTVSVPDRGRVFLGGVNSADSFRQNYGPIPSGTTRGSGLSGGSMSASVHILDLQEMDEAILNSVPDSAVPPALRPRTATSTSEPAREVVSSAEKAANFERMARQAEVAGKLGVAKLHWQMAAKHGSTIAAEKLKSKAIDVARAPVTK